MKLEFARIQKIDARAWTGGQATGHECARANPAGTDTGNEWVELYNPTDQTVNIGGWKLFTTKGDTVTRTIS